MGSYPEILLTSANSCSAYDLDTGNLIANYKEKNIAPKTLSFLGEDYLIAAIENQPKIKVWTVSKMRINESGSFICRGLVTSLTATRCGSYCIGAIEKEINIWQVSTGNLLCIVSRHYGDITCLRLSSDDSHVLSGGKDGYVLVWVLSQMIGVHLDKNNIKPRLVWSEHSSEITDIHTGSLGAISRVATTSLDMTCRIYEMDTGIMLTTIFMDVPLTSVVSDPLDNFIFLGANNGYIYKINVYERLPREIHFDEKEEVQFKAHEQKVFSLSMSVDGLRLLSASEDGICRLWDADSMSCLLQFTSEGTLTNAFLTIQPTALAAKEPVLPRFFIRCFKKQLDLIPDPKDVLIEAKLQTKPLSLINLGDVDKIYSSDILQSALPVTEEELKDPRRKNYEDMYQESLHGGVVNELKSVNKQLYSYILNHGLDNLKAHPSD